MQYSHPDLGLTWGPDPELTKLGVAQAEAVQKCWRTQAPLGAPISKEEMKWYVSPLTRTAQTMLHSWGDMLADTPEVWEDWREVYGSHTCDKRRSRVSSRLIKLRSSRLTADIHRGALPVVQARRHRDGGG